MKPRFELFKKNNSHGTPSSTRKEGSSNSKNVHQQEGRIRLGENSSASGAQSKSYECHHITQPVSGSGETDWQQASGGQPVSSENQQIVCQLTDDNNQHSAGQQQETRNASGQLRIYEERTANMCIQQEPSTSSPQNQPRQLAPTDACASVPQPKVMCVAPPFEGTAVYKEEFHEVKLSDYRGRYLCLLFYPLDFTFVCPTEILAMSDLHDQFKEVNCAVLGCSCDSPFTHLAYMKTPRVNNGLGEISFPLLSDFKKTISASYNVLTDDGSSERALFIIDPLGIIRCITINDAGVGRNTDEVLRMVQAIKRVDDYDEMYPPNWVPGPTSVTQTRPTPSNHYRQVYNQKSDRKNRKQEEVGCCSSHIAYEKMDRL